MQADPVRRGVNAIEKRERERHAAREQAQEEAEEVASLGRNR